MKNLTRIQIILLCLCILSLPFAYLFWAYPNSPEAKVSNHNGLYITMVSVLLMFGLGLVAFLIDAYRDLSSYSPSSAKLFLMCSISAAVYGFIGFHYMLDFKTHKHQFSAIGLGVSIFYVLVGNYQSTIKPGSAFNGLLSDAYKPEVRVLNNRYQGRVYVSMGLLGLVYFTFFPSADAYGFHAIATMLCSLAAFRLAVYKANKQKIAPKNE
jgi:heme/copper-type cytochrome/quinol oxidase subunit 4